MLAPITGYYLPLNKVSDPVFSQGTMGPGLMVEPLVGELRSPFSGRVEMLHQNWHALVLVPDVSEGLVGSFLIHVGIDSVKLNRRGFRSYVEQGQHIQAGQLLLEFDLELLAESIPHLTTPIIGIEGAWDFSHFPYGYYQAQTPLPIENVIRDQVPVLSKAQGEQSSHGSTIVTKKFAVVSPQGLHARPAAKWVEVLNTSPFEVWISKKEGERVQAKSVLNLLSLGLKLGDHFFVELKTPSSDSQPTIQTQAIVAVEVLRPLKEWAVEVEESDSKFRAENASSDSIGKLQPEASSWLWICAQDAMAPLRKMQMEGTEDIAPWLPPDLNTEKEKIYFLTCRAQVVAQIEQEICDAQVGTEREILATHLEIVKDSEMWAQAQLDSKPFRQWWKRLEEKRQSLSCLKENPYLQERAMDIQDIQHRFIAVLKNEKMDPHASQPFIALAKWVTPSLFLKWRKWGMVGLITEEGGPLSHVAILAKSIPLAYVSNVSLKAFSRLEELGGSRGQGDPNDPESPARDKGFAPEKDPAPGVNPIRGLNPAANRNSPPDRVSVADHLPFVVISAHHKTIIWDPTESEKAEYLSRHLGQKKQAQALREKALQGPVKTVDGSSIKVYGNIANPREAALVAPWGADGIGLVRSEFLFMERSSPPSLEEQRSAYLEILNHMGSGQEQVIIRTFDVGGDKPIYYLHLPKEENPFLGQRGARLYFDHRALFLEQLQALYEAQTLYQQSGGQVRLSVMLPMLSQLAEWQQMQTWSLPALDYGVMIEVPSAALSSHHWAQSVNFMSIGSNDLTQYTLAMDRGLSALSNQADGLDPAVLNLMNQTAQAGLKNHCPVGLCGGLGGDPLALPFLIGMSLHEISVSLPQVPYVKALISHFNAEACQQLLAQALQVKGAAEVRNLSQQFYDRHKIPWQEIWISQGSITEKELL